MSAPGWEHEPSLAELLALTDARRFVPETIGLLLLIGVARAWWMQEIPLAGGMPHPFWIPTLLMATQYGMMGGLFAAIAATAALFLGGLPEQSVTQDFYAYAAAVAAQPCAWFAAALVIGGLRTLHMHRAAEVEERLRQTTAMAEELGDGLEHAAQEVDRLEQRIAADGSTLWALLHSLGKLDGRDPRSLLQGFVDVIRYGAGASSFVIYVNEASGLRPCLNVVDGIIGSAEAPEAVAAGPGSGWDETSAQGLAANDEHGSLPMPFWTPVHAADGSLMAAILCTRLQPQRAAASARQCLRDIGRLMAVVLDRYPESGRKAN
jgi:hypothetical protein